MSRASEVYGRGWRRGWEIAPELTPSQWADRFLVLSPRYAAEYGRYRSARTPYAVEIMDSLGVDTDVRKTVFMKGRQVAGSTIPMAWAFYLAHTTPRPILFFRPTEGSAIKLSKERIATTIEATPVLRELFAAPRSRDGSNTTLVKEFVGGMLTLAGGNSASSVKSSSSPYLVLDELDEFTENLADQGSAIGLIVESTATFPNRKIFMDSTPTFRGRSNIEAEYLKGDQRRYLIPCPHCGREDWIEWREESGHHFIAWTKDDPASAHMVCSGCLQSVHEDRKTWMLERGRWEPTAEASEPGTRSYHLPAYYSPVGWKSWETCAREFLAAQQDPVKLKEWVNNVAGEPYEDRSEGVEEKTLARRLEVYPNRPDADVPNGVGALFSSIDTQADRLEGLILGFGAGEEVWVIDTHVVYGDPDAQQTWLDMEKEFLLRRLLHESGREVTIDGCAVDVGFKPDSAYRFVKSRQKRRYHGVRGTRDKGRPLVGRFSDRNNYRARVYNLCVDTGKDTVMSRLRIQTPGPGFIHLPSWVDPEMSPDGAKADRWHPEFLGQLTAEKKLWKTIKGRRPSYDWVKTQDRNEALDLFVYALAALYIRGEAFIRGLKQRAEEWARPPEKPESGGGDGGQQQPKPAPVSPQQPRRNWVTGWR